MAGRFTKAQDLQNIQFYQELMSISKNKNKSHASFVVNQILLLKKFEIRGEAQKRTFVWGWGHEIERKGTIREESKFPEFSLSFFVDGHYSTEGVLSFWSYPLDFNNLHSAHIFYSGFCLVNFCWFYATISIGHLNLVWLRLSTFLSMHTRLFLWHWIDIFQISIQNVFLHQFTLPIQNIFCWVFWHGLSIGKLGPLVHNKTVYRFPFKVPDCVPTYHWDIK